MKTWMKKIHRWIGLLIGLQLLLWMASGFVMSLLDSETVRGQVHRAPPPAKRAWPAQALPVDAVLRAARTEVRSLSTGWLIDQPVYRLTTTRGVKLVGALRGETIELDAAMAQRLAQASYRGLGQPGVARFVPRSLETRAHEGPVWRVDFSDAQETTIYLSAHGDVLEHRNQTWRLFDVFWMLHIMDYSDRKDFNNPLVVSAAVGGFWLALSGVWLLFASLRLTDFVPRRWRGSRALKLLLPDGSRLSTLRVASGDTVFAALAGQGLQLPSNCGGGQTCGLCAVRVRGNVPAPTRADREQLPAPKIRDGYRLACNLRVGDDMDLELPGGHGIWSLQHARVERVEPLSAAMREIVLAPASRPGAAYRPGAYVQIEVPRYELAASDLQMPPTQRDEWARWKLPPRWSNPSPLRRAYSLAAPVEQVGGRITLLVRFLHGPASAAHHPPGKGSSYLYSLKPGDEVTFAGPFGDFALRPGSREKVFIGGGAGMAPLRAMVRSLLAGGARERVHFWYGARSVADAPYVAEMEAMAAAHPNFSWHLVVSDAAETTNGHADQVPRGMVHEAVHQGLLETHADLASCEFYLCGPPAMLAATRKLLRKLGVDEAMVAFDDFKI